ncbi:MAG: GNAT family N-acetyltransferase [Pseudomonadota bacterium]
MNITQITPRQAQQLCREITTTLPEWFGQPQSNERYVKGMLERTSFAVQSGEPFVGLLALEFPFPNNANIYWMGVKPNYHGQGIGNALISAAEAYAGQQGATTITVETLSPKASDEYYLKTFDFYCKVGFQPLFELCPYGPEQPMVYMCKYLQSDITN